MSEIRKASVMNEEELYAYAKEIQAPFHLLKETARLKRLPVVNFAAGGLATPGTVPSCITGPILIVSHSRCCFDDATWMRRRYVVSSNFRNSLIDSIRSSIVVFVGSGIFHVSYK